MFGINYMSRFLTDACMHIVFSVYRCYCLLKLCKWWALTLNLKSPFQIVNGSKYHLEVAGSGVTPSLDFSFQSYDFGPCFIHRPGLPVAQSTLIIENKDSKDIGYTLFLHLTLFAIDQ